MIDFEIDMFDEAARAAMAVCPEVYATSEHVTVPPRFPALWIEETVNASIDSREDSSGEEQASSLTYTVNVYSNSQSAPKQECKTILQAVDAVMLHRNFTRVMAQTIDNAADPTIYRMVARYTGEVSADGTYYRR